MLIAFYLLLYKNWRMSKLDSQDKDDMKSAIGVTIDEKLDENLKY